MAEVYRDKHNEVDIVHADYREGLSPSPERQMANFQKFAQFIADLKRKDRPLLVLLDLRKLRVDSDIKAIIVRFQETVGEDLKAMAVLQDGHDFDLVVGVIAKVLGVPCERFYGPDTEALDWLAGFA